VLEPNLACAEIIKKVAFPGEIASQDISDLSFLSACEICLGFDKGMIAANLL